MTDKEIEKRVDSICKWNNPGLRAVVIDCVREAIAEDRASRQCCKDEREACLTIIRNRSAELAALRNERLAERRLHVADELGGLLLELGDLGDEIRARSEVKQ